MDVSVRLEKERTKQIYAQMAKEILTAPLIQAVCVWVVVEMLQKKAGFGSISGTVLEAGAMGRLLQPTIEKSIEQMGKVSQAIAPAITPALIAGLK